MFVSNDWDALALGRDTEVTPLSGGVTAKFVYFKDREKDSFGDYFPDDDEVFVIFEVDGNFYKKRGRKSSYGYGIEWFGNPEKVTPVTKTIQTFE